ELISLTDIKAVHGVHLPKRHPFGFTGNRFPALADPVSVVEKERTGNPNRISHASDVLVRPCVGSVMGNHLDDDAFTWINMRTWSDIDVDVVIFGTKVKAID